MNKPCNASIYGYSRSQLIKPLSDLIILPFYSHYWLPVCPLLSMGCWKVLGLKWRQSTHIVLWKDQMQRYQVIRYDNSPDLVLLAWALQIPFVMLTSHSSDRLGVSMMYSFMTFRKFNKSHQVVIDCSTYKILGLSPGFVAYEGLLNLDNMFCTSLLYYELQHQLFNIYVQYVHNILYFWRISPSF